MISPSNKSLCLIGTRALLTARAELFKLDLERMLDGWSCDQPLRAGMPHASAILAEDKEYCLRRLVLQAAKPDDAERPEALPWQARQNAIFLSGWRLHEKYQDLFKRYGDVIECEERHYDETRLLHFTPDAIIQFLGLPAIVEIKGYKSAVFEALDERGAPPRGAHVQVNLYMHLLEIWHGIILVENKDNQDIKVWCVEYDRSMAQPYVDRIYDFKRALVKARVHNELPVRCCSSSHDWKARACPMRSVCFEK